MVAVTSPEFKQNARQALGDAGLQKALAFSKPQFMARRARAVEALPEFERLRDIGRDIKDHALANLDYYLETYAANVERAGGHVHWCPTADDARAAVLAICQKAGAQTVTKGKSMISEELGINEHLERSGIRPIETDLGEYVIQLRREHPSHIIAPAFHLNREDWEATFRQSHADLDPARVFAERRDILTEARTKLRELFLSADVGITGANFLIAETGSSVIVTNEGNWRPDADAAAGAHRAGLHREMRSDAGGRDKPSATACPIGDGAGFLRLHDVLDRRAPARRPGRAGRIPRCPAGWRAVGDAGFRIWRDAAVHPVRGVHEPLPGLRGGGGACLRMGVSRADGQRADALFDRGGPCGAPAQRQHLLRQMRERLPGQDTVAEADAALAGAGIRAPPHAAGHSRQLAALGLVRPASGSIPGNDGSGRAGAQGAGAAPRAVRVAAPG